jgi:hypothetical protein
LAICNKSNEKPKGAKAKDSKESEDAYSLMRSIDDQIYRCKLQQLPTNSRFASI